MARGATYYRDNKAGSLASLKEHLGVANDKDAGIVWEQTHNTFGAELPKEQFREIFELRREDMIAAKQWAPDKPLPDPEQFLTRALLEFDAEGNELRADQARRADALRCRLAPRHSPAQAGFGRIGHEGFTGGRVGRGPCAFV